MATEHRYALQLQGSSLSRVAGRPGGDEGLELRAPEPSEGPDLYAVYRDAFSTRTRTPLDRATWVPKWFLHAECARDLSVVAIVDGEPSGYLLAYWEAARPGEGFIGQLGVRTAVRRRGVGSAMLRSALRRFAARGLSTAVLHVAPDNAEAIRLYEELGFERVLEA